MFTRIMYATQFAGDQDKACDFLVENFGFTMRADFDGPEGRFLTVSLGQGTEVLLWPGTSGHGTGKPGAPEISIPGGLIIESDDLMKDFATLKAKGVRFAESEPEKYPFGLRVTALDPDGNRISLRQTRK